MSAPVARRQRLATAEPAAFADAQRKIRLCFSDGSVDRMGDTIAPDGWRLAGYRRNPVVLWAHDALAPPIGRASNIAVEGERLIGDVEFAAPEIYPFAETIYQLLRSRFISACSVGFAPIKYSFSRDPDRQFGIDFIEQELLEVSIVPIPANANALIEGRASGSGAQADRRERAALLRTYTDPAATPPLAGCAIDRQRDQYRQDQRDRIRREIRCLYLGRKLDTEAQRRVYVEELRRLDCLLADWR